MFDIIYYGNKLPEMKEKGKKIMGYESRVYVGLHHHYYNAKPDKEYVQKIATFELSKMGYDFSKLFDLPIAETTKTKKGKEKIKLKFELFNENGTKAIIKDRYGDILTYTENLDKVVEYLENKIDEGETYRRLISFYTYLKSIKDNIKDWNYDCDKYSINVVLIHYGY